YGGGGSPTAEVAPFSNYCSDTDNGKMYKKYGRVTGFINNQRVSHADECVDDQVVREWYCKNQGSYRIPDDEYASCPGVYGEGAFCAKGRCVVNYGR
ncbi:MAG: hypothetical protein KKG59_04310, partial [Nanoarchaeota archaeon]|nr:hypothetical protein [Nanoarchaeota archaeon]